MKIYIDLDDVVADWNTEAIAFLKEIEVDEDGRLAPNVWPTLRGHTRFYRNLPLMPGATDLVNWALEYGKKHNAPVAFLTAIPRDNDVQYAFYDKVLWAHERFPDIPVFFGPYSYDKQTHCQPGDILFDDRKSNCDEWIAAGGLACRYTTWENCKKWIETNLKD
jgi:hypothetical protein